MGKVTGKQLQRTCPEGVGGGGGVRCSPKKNLKKFAPPPLPDHAGSIPAYRYMQNNIYCFT
jgi:hypothetical protein